MNKTQIIAGLGVVTSACIGFIDACFAAGKRFKAIEILQFLSTHVDFCSRTRQNGVFMVSGEECFRENFNILLVKLENIEVSSQSLDVEQYAAQLLSAVVDVQVVCERGQVDERIFNAYTVGPLDQHAFNINEAGPLFEGEFPSLAKSIILTFINILTECSLLGEINEFLLLVGEQHVGLLPVINSLMTHIDPLLHPPPVGQGGQPQTQVGQVQSVALLVRISTNLDALDRILSNLPQAELGVYDHSRNVLAQKIQSLRQMIRRNADELNRYVVSLDPDDLDFLDDTENLLARQARENAEVRNQPHKGYQSRIQAYQKGQEQRSVVVDLNRAEIKRLEFSVKKTKQELDNVKSDFSKQKMVSTVVILTLLNVAAEKAFPGITSSIQGIAGHHQHSLAHATVSIGAECVMGAAAGGLDALFGGALSMHTDRNLRQDMKVGLKMGCMLGIMGSAFGAAANAPPSLGNLALSL